jgi:hypothetical protein
MISLVQINGFNILQKREETNQWVHNARIHHCAEDGAVNMQEIVKYKMITGPNQS